MTRPGRVEERICLGVCCCSSSGPRGKLRCSHSFFVTVAQKAKNSQESPQPTLALVWEANFQSKLIAGVTIISKLISDSPDAVTACFLTTKTLLRLLLIIQMRLLRL